MAHAHGGDKGKIAEVTAAHPPQDHRKNTTWTTCNLLSLDGGGVRGYWSLLALEELMRHVANEEEKITEEQEKNKLIDQEQYGKAYHSFWPERWPRNVTQVPLTESQTQLADEGATDETQCRAIPPSQRYLPCHYFDYICGSSTGALIAIMLGRFRMTVPDCMHEYEKLGGNVFGKPRHFTMLNFGFIDRTKYDAENLKRVFQDVTKRRTDMGTRQRRITFPCKRGLCKTFVTSLRTKAGHKAVETLYLIRSYDHIQRDLLMRPTRTKSHMGEPNFEKAQDFEIWEVARAATAAPFYFEPLKIDYPGLKGYMSLTDGAFGPYNNPTKVGVKEMERMNAAKSIGIVVSVGTARKDEGNLKRGLFAFKGKAKDLGRKATNTEIVDSDMAEACSKGKGFQYFRLNDYDGLSMEMDEWEPKPNRIYGKVSGSKTLKTIRDTFNSFRGEIDFEGCAKALVECRRARLANDTVWERYATGAEYTCLQGCQRENFDDRGEFQAHLQTVHAITSQDLKAEVKESRRDWVYQPASS